MVKVGRMSYLFENINKGALTAGNKINGYSSKLHWPCSCWNHLMRGRRVGKLLVLPGEPKLVAAMPRQGEERGLLHVLPDEGVQSGESWLVPGVNVSRWAHFKTFYSASVVCDVCHIWCVFFSGFIVPLVTVIHYFSLSSLLSLLFSIILRYSVNNHYSLS